MGESYLLKLKDLLNTFIYDQLEIVFLYGDQVLEVFKYIAFIGALLKILANVNNDPMNWKGYVGYIPLAILLFNYDHVVVGLFEWSSSLDNRISVLESFDKAKHFFTFPEMSFEENSVSEIGWTALTTIVSNAVFGGIVRILLLLSFLVSLIAYMYLKIKMFFKLVILTLFGPLNISLSFLNEFSGNYIGWLTKLIEVCMYIPLIYLVDYVGIEMLNKVFAPRVISSGSEAAETLTRQAMGIIFFVGVILMYLSIPGLVKYTMTQGAQASGTAKKVAAIAMVAMRKMATGGI
ncbi:hypothetical protein HN014_22420 (plasmid) [Aquimarina sp. TRL1]|uniref:hypothetical protein n=1 Tax=Aquimarina sp. (strain TRL1) TaxID=2736252 RepID=UPI00158C8627|nr:hypothetical protein [Aquimarina sp. TRL1]QKX07757.1 hypothetical protein HN014_22420 [Aquimarina sp. TRL1]